MKDYFNYSGKNCVVTGAASGVGKATHDLLVELGANVYSLDVSESKELKNFIHIDMGDKAAIDKAISGLPGKIDSIFSLAALPGLSYRGKQFTLKQLFAVNYAGQRYLTEALLPKMPKGGAVGICSSIAGGMWVRNMALLADLYESYTSFEGALEWAEKNKDNPQAFDGLKSEKVVYGFTKQALTYYTKRAAFKFLKQGVRMNALCPGSIETAMSKDFADQAVREGYVKGIREGYVYGTNPHLNRQSTALEQANVIVFMNSDMATQIIGADITVDGASSVGRMFNQYDGAGNITDER